MDNVMKFISNIYVLSAIVVLIVVLLVFLLSRRRLKKRILKQLGEFEVRYNLIKSVPLSFKLNKSVAIARVSPETMQTVTNSKDDFEKAQVNLRQIAQLIADAEDNVLVGKYKLAKAGLLDIEAAIALGEEQIGKLDAFFDTILEKETAIRTEATEKKDEFRILKKFANEHSSYLTFSWTIIEQQLVAIEKMFSDFEEWMYASDFEKANSKLSDIIFSMATLDDIVHQLPDLLQIGRGYLPSLIDSVALKYDELSKKGVYLRHLEVEYNLNDIAEKLQADLELLRIGKTDGIKENLANYKHIVLELEENVKLEGIAFDKLEGMLNDLQLSCDSSLEKLTILHKTYQELSQRFGLVDLLDKINEEEHKLNVALIEKQKMQDKIDTNNDTPASENLKVVSEVLTSISSCEEAIKEIQDVFNQLQADEARARKQLLKLQLIMNEMQVKIRKHKLPMISSTYDDDLKKAYDYMSCIEDLVNEVPLNVEILNSTLKEAIDFVYKLYNNVNNVVGMAIMVENTIVFGNKYRSTYPEIDSELTRAELCFRNGEYTQALTIAISTIERIHPNSYETLIRENSKSAA